MSSDTPATVFLLSSPKETVFLLTGLTLPETQVEKKYDLPIMKLQALFYQDRLLRLGRGGHPGKEAGHLLAQDQRESQLH